MVTRSVRHLRCGLDLRSGLQMATRWDCVKGCHSEMHLEILMVNQMRLHSDYEKRYRSGWRMVKIRR